MDDHQSTTILTFNALLMSESAAVATYSAVLDRLGKTQIKSELEELRASHARRARKLRRYLRPLRNDCSSIPCPVDPAVIGFTFPSLETTLIDDNCALTALFTGEDRALASYVGALKRLDAEGRNFVMEELLSEQELSHNVVVTLFTGLEPLTKTA